MGGIMKVTRFAKSIVYLVFTTGLFLLSVFFTTGIHNSEHLEQNYFRSTSYLFILAAVLIGGAIYSYQAYTRKYREHAWDSLLLLLTGLALMGTVLFIILYYGGLEGTFTESGYTASNVNIVVLAMLPLPFFVRTAVLVLSLQEPRRGRRLIVQIACAALLVGMILAFALGGLLDMVRYTGADVGDGSYGWEQRLADMDTAG